MPQDGGRRCPIIPEEGPCAPGWRPLLPCHPIRPSWRAPECCLAPRVWCLCVRAWPREVPMLGLPQPQEREGGEAGGGWTWLSGSGLGHLDCCPDPSSRVPQGSRSSP